MPDEATFQPRLLGLQLKAWAIAAGALVVGVTIGLVPWIVAGRVKIDWSWSGWATIIALATLLGILATATATVALATSTRRLASSTHAMVESAHQQAKSTSASVALQREELEAVNAQLQLTREESGLAREQAQQQLRQAESTTVMAREMQRERELAARPYLTVEITKAPYMEHLIVHNVGRGPALDCVWTYVGNAAAEWRRSKVFNIAPGTGRELRPNVDFFIAQPAHPVPKPLWDYGQINKTGQHEVADVHALFCQDETGTKLYRFIDGRVGCDVWQRDPEPPWVTNLVQAFPQFRT